MIFAVLGASHADLTALDSALAAIDEEGITTIVSTGGHAFGGDNAAETVARMQAHRIPNVQGAGDRIVGRFHRKRKQLSRDLTAGEFAQAEAAYAVLDSTQVEWLNTLPKIVRRAVDGIDFVIMSDPFLNSSSNSTLVDDDDRLRRMREEANAPLVIVGGAEPFSRECDGALFVCPGTLADAEAADTARYAVVSTESRPWQAEFRSVPLISI